MKGETRLRLTLRKGDPELYLTMEEIRNTEDGTESFNESDCEMSGDIKDISTGNEDELLTTQNTKKYQGEKINSSTSEWRSLKEIVGRF